MARRMDYTIEFDAPAEKICRDFTSREYWQTLMDAYCFLTPQSEITSFATGDRGIIGGPSLHHIKQLFRRRGGGTPLARCGPTRLRGSVHR
jgi:hypothetical protein